MLTKGHNIRNTGKTHFKKGHDGFWLGKHPVHSKESITKRSGNKSVDWKGDKVSYSGLHKWVNKWKGKPTTCEGCGRTALNGRKIHWANIDHKYRRVLEDYIRLCVPCHSEFDILKNNK